MAKPVRDTDSWLARHEGLHYNWLIPAPVDQLYCIRNAEVKEYHVLAASWSSPDSSDGRAIPSSFLS
jgi:hypothetical protein